MAYLSTNEFPGTGAIMQVEINFAGNRPGAGSGVNPYFNVADVKALRIVPPSTTSVGSETAVALTAVNANTFRTAVAIPVGQTLRVYRESQDEYGLVDFQALQLVTEDNLDTLAKQTLFVAMEAKDSAGIAGNYAKSAIALAVAANTTSGTAVATANAAVVTANNAAAVAAGANAKSDQAVSTSNSAANVANLANQASLAAVAAAEAATDAIGSTIADVTEIVNEATGRFLDPRTSNPATRDDGSALVTGDRYLNTMSGVEFIYKAGAWAANNVDGADLANSGDPAKGAALVGLEGSNVAARLGFFVPLAGYSELAAYGGPGSAVVLTNPGVAGRFVKRTGSYTPDFGTVIAGVGGAFWVREYTGFVDLRWFDTSANIATDCSLALERALNTGKQVLVNGDFVALRKVAVLGECKLFALSRTSGTITYPVGATTAGFAITPQNLFQQSSFENVQIIVKSLSTGGEDIISASWAGLTDYATETNFSYKFVMKNCLIAAREGGLYRKGVYLLDVFGAVFEHNHVYGAGRTLFNATQASYPTTHCIHIDNDATNNNTVGVKMHNNHLYYGRQACLVNDVEGVDFTLNDIQACWDGLKINNTIRKVNQYRITGNHIGVDNNAFYIFNARCPMLYDNEFSWGSNRANGATINYVIIDTCDDLSALGNTFRGNGARTTYGHTITGLQILGTTALPSNNGVVDCNRFRDLSVGCAQSDGVTNLLFGFQNAFNAVVTRYTCATVVNANPQIKYGSGPHTNPPSVGSAVSISTQNQSALTINRQTGGGGASAVTFHVDNGALSGSISVSSTTTTYATSSDATLKTDRGELSIDAALEVIRLVNIHEYSWNANSVVDYGVFAQELYEVFPSAVVKGGWRDIDTDQPADEGAANAHYVPWGVDYSKLIPVMLRVMQHLIKISL